jgi:hypothetical protein
MLKLWARSDHALSKKELHPMFELSNFGSVRPIEHRSARTTVTNRAKLPHMAARPPTQSF